MKANYIIILLSLGIWLGCKKEIQLDNSDKGYPLQLQYSGNDNGVFSWDEVKVTGFERYILTSQAQPTGTGTGPTGNTVFESTEYDKNSAFAFSSLNFDSITYYKLYARLNNRWLESNEVVVKKQILVFNGTPVAQAYLPDSNWVITLKTDINGGSIAKLVVSDLNKNKTYSSNTSFTITTSDQIAMGVGIGDGKPELYITTNSSFRRLSLPTLVPLSQHTSITSPFSVVQTGYNTLLLTHQHPTKSMSLRKRQDFVVIKESSSTEYFNHRTLAVLDTTATDALILETSLNTSRIFRINTTTGTITNNVSISEFSNGIFNLNIPISKDGESFMSNGSGIIRNKNLIQVGSISTAIANFFVSSAVFSDTDPDFVYVNGIDFFNGVSSLRKIRISNSSDFIDFPLNQGLGLSQFGKVKGGLVGTFLNQQGGNSRFVIQYINF